MSNILKLFALILCLQINLAFADTCSEILNQGIYDKYSVLNSKEQYNLSKSLTCKKSNTSLNFSDPTGISSGFSSQKDYCNTRYDEAQANSLYVKHTETVNSSIVDAWSNCITQTSNGVIQYITPTANPESFTYFIQFRPGGIKNEAIVKTWFIQPESVLCNKVLKEGDKISNVGELIHCTRNKDDQVVIGAVTDEQMKSSNSLILPPYTEAPLPVISGISKKSGVTDITGIWPVPANSAAPQRCAALGDGWSVASWDGKSHIAYCKKIEVSDSFITKFTDGPKNKCDTKGSNWSNAVWDGKSGTMFCKEKIGAEQLEKDGILFLKDITSIYPEKCSEKFTELYRIGSSEISFCGVMDKIVRQ